MGIPAISNEIRLKVVEDWLELGNLKQAAHQNSVDYGTVKNWKTSDWWKEYEDEILAQRRISVQNKIGSIVDAGLGVVQDRLENGEFFVDQDGSVKRRPVKLRDAATAVNGLMQRQSILEKQNAGYADKRASKTISEQLTFLAEEFAKFNRRDKSKAQTIEYVEKV